MDALPRPPVEPRADPRIQRFGDVGDEPRLGPVPLGEVNVKVLAVQRAPLEARIDPRELVPLRRG